MIRVSLLTKESLPRKPTAASEKLCYFQGVVTLGSYGNIKQFRYKSLISTHSLTICVLISTDRREQERCVQVHVCPMSDDQLPLTKPSDRAFITRSSTCGKKVDIEMSVWSD